MITPRWLRLAGLFAFQGLRYIGSMSEGQKTLYVVSVIEDVDGRKGRHVLLRTSDKDAADELYASLLADTGVNAKFQVILPGAVE